MIMENDKLLVVDGSFNVRELGGYKTADGKEIKTHRFLRAGQLATLTDAGIKTLVDYGVNCVVDLRSDSETQKSPDKIGMEQNVQYHNVRLSDGLYSTASGDDTQPFATSLEEMYTGFIDKCQGAVKEVFDIFCLPQNECVLFHCTAGKDRTGTVAMLLLGLAGVDDDIIAEDYAVSENYLDMKFFEKEKDFSKIPAHLFKTPKAAMQFTLKHIRKNYGSVDQYLTVVGVTDEQKEIIKAKMFN